MKRKKFLNLIGNTILLSVMTCGIVYGCSEYVKTKDETKTESVIIKENIDKNNIDMFEKMESRIYIREIAPEPYLIESTAYYNKYSQFCFDGTYPEEGITIAGKEEWIGKTAILYYEKDDGSIGEMIGIFEFHDTGFGNDLDGDGIGSIEGGTCIDIFMERKEDCIQWGRRNVWIQILDARG